MTIDPEGILVNGSYLQGPAPGVDSHGRPLETLPPGDYALSPDELWLYSASPRSWDSRFYGPVRVENVLETVQPLWTWGS